MEDWNEKLEALQGMIDAPNQLPTGVDTVIDTSTLLLQYKELIRKRDSELDELLKRISHTHKQELLLKENRIKQLTVKNNNLKDEIVALRAAQKDRNKIVIDEYQSRIDNSELQLNNSNDNIFNEDCLLKIFSYLSMDDMMQVKEVCKKWNQVSQEWFKQVQTLEFHVDEEGDITVKLYEKYYKRKIYEKTDIYGLLDLILILHSYGHHIKYYKARDCLQDNQTNPNEIFIFQWIPILCENVVDADIFVIHDIYFNPNFEVMATHWEKLEKIEIGSRYLWQDDDENFLKLLHNNKQLKIMNTTDSESYKFFHHIPTKIKEISIKNMSIDDEEQWNHFISASRNFTLLQSFELSDSSHCLTDAVVAAIVNIKSLTHLSLYHNSFEYCKTIDSIANLTGLKALFLRYSSDLSEDSIINIVKGCIQLEQLDISTEVLTDKGMAAIAELEKLKCLFIYMKNVTTESMIYSCEKLEALWICDSKMNDSDATKLLKKLTNLRFVGFNHCEAITKDILQAAKGIANERKNNILYITAYNSTFHNEVIENIDTPFLKYIQYSDFFEDLPMEKFPIDIRNFMEKEIEINIGEAKYW